MSQQCLGHVPAVSGTRPSSVQDTSTLMSKLTDAGFGKCEMTATTYEAVVCHVGQHGAEGDGRSDVGKEDEDHRSQRLDADGIADVPPVVWVPPLHISD